MIQEKLQHIQDIISKYSLLPLKLYKYNPDEEGGLKPITNWSNPSFYHLFIDEKLGEDVKGSQKIQAFEEFSGIRQLFENETKEKIIPVIDTSFKHSWKENPWEIIKIDYMLNSLIFYIIPIVDAYKNAVEYIAWKENKDEIEKFRKLEEVEWYIYNEISRVLKLA